MNCQKCFGDTEVIDSRNTDGGGSVRRRRQCLSKKCGHRFTTYEEDVDRGQEMWVVITGEEIARAIKEALRHQKTSVVVRGYPTSQRGPG